MKYRIRNKSTKPILTFTDKAWWEITENYSPEAYVIAWGCLKKYYKQITGKELDLDYKQKEDFTRWVGANELGVWTAKTSNLDHTDYLIYTAFCEGFKLDDDFKSTIEIAERFIVLITNSSLGLTK